MLAKTRSAILTRGDERESVQFLMNGSSERRYEWTILRATRGVPTNQPTNPSPFLTYAKILKVNKPTTRCLYKLSSKAFLICFYQDIFRLLFIEEGNPSIIARIFDICQNLLNRPARSA